MYENFFFFLFRAIMKIVVFGHSYVRDLKLFCLNNNITSVKVSQNNSLELKFSFVSGATFNKFITDTSLLTELFENPPQIVLVILGGNDIRTDTDLTRVREDCKEFYGLLRLHLPDTYIIATQIESRYLVTANKFKTPPSLEFTRLSNYFNHWLNKQKFKDRLLCIRGSGRLCNPSLYRDGVHLNSKGLTVFWDLTRKVLVDTCLNKLKIQ